MKLCIRKSASKRDKKAKGTKMSLKRKLKFEDYKHWLEVTQLENKITHLINKVDVKSLMENHKELKQENQIIWKQ